MELVNPSMARPEPGIPRPSFGIQEAIRLVRRLPFEQNRELVTSVLKNTLESLGVAIRDLIADATRHQGAIQDRIAEAHREIVDLEARIRGCHEEIARLGVEDREIVETVARLEHIEAIHRGMTTHVYTRFDL